MPRYRGLGSTPYYYKGSEKAEIGGHWGHSRCGMPTPDLMACQAHGRSPHLINSPNLAIVYSPGDHLVLGFK